MTGAAVTVVYVLGTPRSGSTLVTSLLGRRSGCFAAGEIRLLWRELATRVCGCGHPAVRCPVWGRVVSSVRSTVDLDGVDALLDATRIPHLPAVRRARTLEDLDDRSRRLAELLHRTYLAVREVTGAAAIIDSSKAVVEAELLRLLPGIRPVVVHTVRDPRAVVHSWRRAVARGAIGTPERASWSIASRWVLTNLASEFTLSGGRAPRVLLRYEDLVRDPDAAIARIVRVAGLDRPGLPAGRTDHIVAGNALRRSATPVTVRPDEEWAAALGTARRLEIAAITSPMRWRYGYAFTTDHAATEGTA